MRSRSLFWSMALACLLVLVACSTYSSTFQRLHYEVSGPTDWSKLGRGEYGGGVFGASVRIELHDEDTLIKVVIENPTDAALTFQLGPDSGDEKMAIGEVLLRELHGRGVGGPAMQGYTSRQVLRLDSGWRATFFLDAPLGRKIVLGQYLVFSTVVVDGEGQRLRLLLPLQAVVGRPAGSRSLR